jgi:hypothetical protein
MNLYFKATCCVDIILQKVVIEQNDCFMFHQLDCLGTKYFLVQKNNDELVHSKLLDYEIEELRKL